MAALKHDIPGKLIDEVSELLEGDDPITKKDACEKLGIAYNTPRLARIIKERKEKVAFVIQKRKEKRGKPANESEMSGFISDYLDGDSLNAIAERNFRSPGFVKSCLERAGVPIRSRNSDYRMPVDLDERHWADDYVSGDLVFSARYNQVGKIRELYQDHEVHGKVFSMRLLKDNKYCYQPWYELADLRELNNKYNLIIT